MGELINKLSEFLSSIINEPTFFTYREWAILIVGVGLAIILTPIAKMLWRFLVKVLYSYGFKKIYKFFHVTKFDKRCDVLQQLDVNIDYRQIDIYRRSDKVPPIFNLTPSTESRLVVSPFNEETRRVNRKASKKKKNDELFFLPSVIDFKFKMASPHITHDDENIYGCLQGREAKDIIKNIITPCINDTEPSIISVFGRIGCGKSTLIESILVEYEKENTARQGQTQYFPIVINVREAFGKVFESIIKDSVLDKKNIERLLELELVSHIKEVCDTNFDAVHKEKYSGDTNLKGIVYSLMNKLQCTPIIVLDELDTIYSTFCKATFCLLNNIPMHQYRARYKHILKYFFTIPTDEMNKGRLNNCVFIIVCRSSSERLYEEIISENDNLSANGIFSSVGHSIHIEDYDSEYANKVIVKRLEIKLEYVRSKFRNIENSENIIAVLGNTIEVMKNKPIDYNENLSISIHGLRHIMLLLGKAEMIDRECELLTKYINYPSLLKTFQYLDGRPDFHVTREGVSNIFLVNTQYALSSTDLDDKDYRSSVLEEHLYTFSLKYLVIGYIVACHNERNYVYLEDVYDLFSDKGGDEHMVYEYELLQTALFHATEVEHGRLIKLAYDKGKNKFYLRPSKRAYAMFDDGLFWEFGYLMVIVEDKWIEVPEALSKVFQINKKYNANDNIETTFDFFTNLHEAKYEEKIQFLKSKIDAVFTFCYILECAFYYEEKRYKKCFSVFKQSSRTNSDILNVSHNIDHLETSVIGFTSKFIGDKGNKEIKEYIKANKQKIKFRTKYHMHTFYMKYHTSISLVSIDDKMKHYHATRTRL